LVEESFDSVFSATESHGFLWQRTSDGQAHAVNHDASRRDRRQDRVAQHPDRTAVHLRA
jgi:N-acylneuraminate cytidylyltransferase